MAKIRRRARSEEGIKSGGEKLGEISEKFAWQGENGEEKFLEKFAWQKKKLPARNLPVFQKKS